MAVGVRHWPSRLSVLHANISLCAPTEKIFCFFYGKSAMRGAFFLRRSKGGRKFLKNASCFKNLFCFACCVFNFLSIFQFFFLLK